MRAIIFLNLAIAFISLLPFQGDSQTIIRGVLKIGNTRQTQILKTVRGDSFIGSVVFIDSSGYFFRLKNKGVIYFKSINVTSISVVKRKDLRPKNEVFEKTERLMLLPTGFMMEQGDCEYYNQMLVVHNFNYGINSKYSTGVGLIALPRTLISWVNLKRSIIEAKNFHWALGGLMGIGKDFNDFDVQNSRIILPFNSITLGQRRRYLNFSVSKGIVDNEGDGEWSPWLYAVGAKIYANKKSSISLEVNNFFYDKKPTEKNYLFSYSHLGKKSVTYFGFFIGGEAGVFPLISYSRTISRN